MRNALKEKYQRPEGRLVEAYLNGLSVPKLAERLGMKHADWLRHQINGYRTPSKGVYKPVEFETKTLARAARELFIPVKALRDIGRDDAAEQLLLTGSPSEPAAKPAPSDDAIKEVLTYLTEQRERERHAKES